MESLAPPMVLLMICKTQIERGQTIKSGIREFLNQNKGPFSFQVAGWLYKIENGQPTLEIIEQIESIHRRKLLEVLERGISREPIYGLLQEMEAEITDACEENIQNELTDLPYKLMIPILFFMFPAFMALLLGPLLAQLLDSMN